MITALRHLVVDSWVGRIIALLIFLAFVGWGVGDMVGSYSGNQANIAIKVGTRDVTAQDLDVALRSQLMQLARQSGFQSPTQLPAETRQQAGQQVLQRLLAQAEILALADRNGMKIPDALVRQTVFAMPFFHGTDGRFDRAVMNRKLAQIGMSERDLLSKVRDDIATRNLLEGLGNTMNVPNAMLDRLTGFDAQEHVIDLIRLDATAMQVPAPAEESQLRRFYDTHPWLYRTTEYRHAKAVVLTAGTIARTLTFADEDLRRYYDLEIRKYDVPETRSIEALTVADKGKAEALLRDWQENGAWDAIQKRDPEAASVAFPDARADSIPSPELARAAFAAQPDKIEGPIRTETGWVVFRVTSVKPPHKTDFDHAKAEIRDEAAKLQAPQLLAARVAKLQDAIAGSRDLEQIPSDIGAVPAQGSLDAQGLTKDGEVAPLPGDEALRKALIARIFSQGKDEAPSLVNGPEGSAFAVLVDAIEPGHVKPYDEVREQVAHDWRKAQQDRMAEIRATALMRAARAAHGLGPSVAGTQDAALLQTGLAVSRVQTAGLPSELLGEIFSTGKGKTAMVTHGDDYYVFTVTGTRMPPPEATKSLNDMMRSQLVDSYHADIPIMVVRSLENEIKPKPNLAVIKRVLGAENGEAAQ